jgi:hypothetical protein
MDSSREAIDDAERRRIRPRSAAACRCVPMSRSPDRSWTGHRSPETGNLSRPATSSYPTTMVNGLVTECFGLALSVRVTLNG